MSLQSGLHRSAPSVSSSSCAAKMNRLYFLSLTTLFDQFYPDTSDVHARSKFLLAHMNSASSSFSAHSAPGVWSRYIGGQKHRRYLFVRVSESTGHHEDLRVCGSPGDRGTTLRCPRWVKIILICRLEKKNTKSVPYPTYWTYENEKKKWFK